MSLARRMVVFGMRGLTRVICWVHDEKLGRIPRQGPLILVTNHVNIIEIPIIYTHLYPRPVYGLVLARRWQNPLFRWLLDTCQAIPLKRGEPDLAAIRKGLEVLTAGGILIIAPEGTRSGDGRLQEAHPGVVMLALHSGAPLLPIAFHGSESYLKNLRRLKRTDFFIEVGESFRLDLSNQKVTHLVRQQIITEIMGQVARLLPVHYRGYYRQASEQAPIYIK